MMDQSIQMSRKPHIVVATPGRLCDLLETNNISLKGVKYMVFDEADRLLASNSTFLISEIPSIVQRINLDTARLLFFSATMSKDVHRFHRNIATTPRTLFEFNANEKFELPEHLHQFYILTPSQVRETFLVSLFRGPLASKTAIIFVGKCRTCELLTETMRKLKFSVVGLHSTMPQRQRIANLQRFRSGICKVLVSTDVGSRGLDIPTVEFVVNYDIPADPRDYVHRVGRAARAGRSGTAISLVKELDVEIFKKIEHIIKQVVPIYPFAPKESEVIALLNEVSTAKRAVEINLHDSKFGFKQEKNIAKWKSV